jgi:hypothetical protein
LPFHVGARLAHAERRRCGRCRDTQRGGVVEGFEELVSDLVVKLPVELPGRERRSMYVSSVFGATECC